jgi:hypothetical protein
MPAGKDRWLAPEAHLRLSFGQVVAKWWPSGTKAAPCRFTAQGAEAAAGPLVETLTGRLYHDAGEANFQKEEQKGSLV